jgi:hypothetical protein
MKFIRTFENFTEMDMGHQNMEEMCPDCQCKVVECECGSPMAYEDEMEEEYPYEGGMSGGEGFPSHFDEEEEDMMDYEEEEDMMGEEEEDMMPSEHKMGHIMSFHEAKKADKMTKKEKELAAKYPPKDKITRGDIITAAKENADKKKGGKKEEEKESTKKGGLSKAQEEKLPEGLKKKIAPKSKK